MTWCLSPAPACTHCPTAASQRSTGAGTFGNNKLRAASPSPATPQLLRMVLLAEEAKPSEAAGVLLRLAQLRTRLAALFWSKKGSVAPCPQLQKSLMVKPQRAAASQPSSLAATPRPRPEPGHTARAGGSRECSQW